MTTELRGSEFTTLANKTVANNKAAFGAKPYSMKMSLIGRRNLRRDRRAVRAI